MPITATTSTNSNSDARQHTVVLQYGQTPASALRAVEPDEQLLDEAARKGAVWVRKRRPNGQLAKLVRLRELAVPLLDGSEVIANLNPQVLLQTVPAPSLLETHKNYSFWFKPRGVLSQGSKWGDHTSMPYLVESLANRPAHLVHRLDRFACGLMVLAHTRPAVRELSALFARRKVNKRYRVCVEGEWMHPTPYEMNAPIDEQEALTEVMSAQGFNDATTQSILVVRLHSGRKHQIRRHLADCGHAVVGDTQYGTAQIDTPLALMATEIGFQCPFTHKLIHCALPQNLLNTL